MVLVQGIQGRRLYYQGRRLAVAFPFPARPWDAGSETVAPIGAAGLRGLGGSASASSIALSPTAPLPVTPVTWPGSVADSWPDVRRANPLPVTPVTSPVSGGVRPRPWVTEPPGVTGRGSDDSFVFKGVTGVTDIWCESAPGQYAFHSGSNTSRLYPFRMPPSDSRTVFGVTWNGLSTLASPCGESGLPLS